MSKALITEQLLTDIADAIRAKLGVETEYARMVHWHPRV